MSAIETPRKVCVWNLPQSRSRSKLPQDVPFAFSLQARIARLQTLTDKRAARGVRYPLDCLLVVAVLGRLAGYTRREPRADWARLRAADRAALLGLKRTTMPHQSTWSRVFGYAIDVDDRARVLGQFFQEQQATHEVPARASIVRAVDGKTVRGTIPRGHTRCTSGCRIPSRASRGSWPSGGRAQSE